MAEKVFGVRLHCINGRLLEAPIVDPKKAKAEVQAIATNGYWLWQNGVESDFIPPQSIVRLELLFKKAE